MAEHQVAFSLPKREIGRADVIFSVSKDSSKIGELRVSNGSLVWFPRDAKKGHRIEWQAFEDFAKDSRKLENRKKR
jgi:hypothetical protein